MLLKVNINSSFQASFYVDDVPKLWMWVAKKYKGKLWKCWHTGSLGIIFIFMIQRAEAVTSV